MTSTLLAAARTFRGSLILLAVLVGVSVALATGLGGASAVFDDDAVVQNVTFAKIVCPKLSDVPQNYAHGIANDTPFADANAAAVGEAAAYPDAGDAVSLQLPANCSYATGSWTFDLGTTQSGNRAATDLGTVVLTTGNPKTIQLTSAQLDAALNASGSTPRGMWVSEELQAGFGFGNLKCYTDHFGFDDLDLIKLSEAGTANVNCIAYNVPTTQEVAPHADVVIHKMICNAGATSCTAAAAGTWSFTVNSQTSDGSPVFFASPKNEDTLPLTVAGPPYFQAKYTVTEQAKAGFQLIDMVANDGASCPQSTSGGPTSVVIRVTLGAGQVAGEELLTPVPAVSDSFVEVGGIVHICAYNVATTRTLKVRKVITGTSADSAASFTMTTNPGNLSTSASANDGARLVSDQLAPGTYTLAESAKAGYALRGYKVVYGTDAQCPALTSGFDATASADLTTKTDALVCVYNEPRVNIKVSKAEIIGGSSTPGSGWSVTLAGCGTTLSNTTGADGTYTFKDVPACASYAVSENTASKPGFAASGPASVAVSALTAGQTYNVSFTNVKFSGCAEGCSNPTPPPTSPPATVTQPAVPTPVITQVTLGEKTPGPVAKSTPIAPATGSGANSNGGAMNVALALMGVVALSGGLAVFAAGRKRS